MTPKRNILLCCNSEYGQAQVMLAVLYELLLQGQFNIHIASFPALQPRVERLNESLRDGVSPATFHTINCHSMVERIVRDTGSMAAFAHPAGLFGAPKGYKMVPNSVGAWTGPEYVSCYQRLMEIVKGLNPSVVVVDTLLSPAIDACKTLKQIYIIMSPVGLKELIGFIQPWSSIFGKYPAICSGYPFPLPWYYILANIYLTVRLIAFMLSSRKLWSLSKYRNRHGIDGPLPCYAPYDPEIQYICPASRESDFPFLSIPANITLCGTLFPPVTPVGESGPELAEWLRNRSTVLVNLGSHMTSDGADAMAMAMGLRVMLDSRPDVQVLWKLKSRNSQDTELDLILGKELRSGRVIIKDWLVADPLAILETGQVICSVHHGGANSYFEACGQVLLTGVLHIVLPVWYDTYDFAARVEYLNVGIYGNRKVAPHVDAAEFGSALMAITDDSSEKVKSMRERAKEIARSCQAGGGRRRACERILELATQEI